MANCGQPIKAGDKSISANGYNAMRQTVLELAEKSNAGINPAGIKAYTVTGFNSSDVDIPFGGIVQIRTGSTIDSTDEDEIISLRMTDRETVYISPPDDGLLPTHNQYGIAADPIRAGEAGAVVVAGVACCKVLSQYNQSNFYYAEPIHGDCTKAAKNTQGCFHILSSQPARDDNEALWCIVTVNDCKKDSLYCIKNASTHGYNAKNTASLPMALDNNETEHLWSRNADGLTPYEIVNTAGTQVYNPLGFYMGEGQKAIIARVAGYPGSGRYNYTGVGDTDPLIADAYTIIGVNNEFTVELNVDDDWAAGDVLALSEDLSGEHNNVNRDDTLVVCQLSMADLNLPQDQATYRMPVKLLTDNTGVNPKMGTLVSYTDGNLADNVKYRVGLGSNRELTSSADWLNYDYMTRNRRDPVIVENYSWVMAATIDANKEIYYGDKAIRVYLPPASSSNPPDLIPDVWAGDYILCHINLTKSDALSATILQCNYGYPRGYVHCEWGGRSRNSTRWDDITESTLPQNLNYPIYYTIGSSTASTSYLNSYDASAGTPGAVLWPKAVQFWQKKANLYGL